MDISVDYGEVYAGVTRQLAYDLVDELSLLKPLPDVTTCRIQGKHRVMFDVKNDRSVLVDDGPKMCGGSLHGSRLNTLDNLRGFDKRHA
jgi:hypothetical protein